MKILVFSDSHGVEDGLIQAIKDNQNAKAMIFLGDGERDFEYALANFGIFPYGSVVKDVYQVRGNCDLYSNASDSVTAEIKGVRFFITHGYEQKVKRGLERLSAEAAGKNCSVALFGHTHERLLSDISGVKLFNPGSVRSGSYGVIKIKHNEITFDWRDIK